MPVKVIKLIREEHSYNNTPYTQTWALNVVSGKNLIENPGNKKYLEEVYSMNEVDQKITSEIAKSLSQIQQDLQTIKKQILEDKPYRNAITESLMEKEKFIEEVSEKVASIIQSSEQ